MALRNDNESITESNGNLLSRKSPRIGFRAMKLSKVKLRGVVIWPFKCPFQGIRAFRVLPTLLRVAQQINGPQSLLKVDSFRPSVGQ